MNLPIRKHAPDGSLALRDSFVFTLFMRKSHPALVPNIDRVFDAYLKFCGPSAARWIHGEEEYVELTPRRMSSARKRLSTLPAKSEFSLIVVGGAGRESDAPDFYFDYTGQDLDALASEYGSPNENSYLEAWYPTELIAQAGPEKLLAHLLQLAGDLEFASGYGSLALHIPEWAVSQTWSSARPLLLRHPGLALSQAGTTAINLGDDVRGAFWLTLLGTAQLERLGMTVPALKKKLGPDVSVHPLAHGVALQAGPTPELGDVNKGDRLPLVRRVAELIEPISYTPVTALGGFELDDFEEYERRHTQ